MSSLSCVFDILFAHLPPAGRCNCKDLPGYRAARRDHVGIARGNFERRRRRWSGARPRGSSGGVRTGNGGASGRGRRRRRWRDARLHVPHPIPGQGARASAAGSSRVRRRLEGASAGRDGGPGRAPEADRARQGQGPRRLSPPRDAGPQGQRAVPVHAHGHARRQTARARGVSTRPRESGRGF